MWTSPQEHRGGFPGQADALLARKAAHQHQQHAGTSSLHAPRRGDSMSSERSGRMSGGVMMGGGGIAYPPAPPPWMPSSVGGAAPEMTTFTSSMHHSHAAAQTAHETLRHSPPRALHQQHVDPWNVSSRRPLSEERGEIDDYHDGGQRRFGGRAPSPRTVTTPVRGAVGPQRAAANSMAASRARTPKSTVQAPATARTPTASGHGTARGGSGQSLRASPAYLTDSTVVGGSYAAQPFGGFSTAAHTSLSANPLSRDISLAEQLREKDRLLEQCLRDKRLLENQLHEERVVVATERARVRQDLYNEFMHALRHGGTVAVEELGRKIARQQDGDGVSPKGLDNAENNGAFQGQDVPYFCPTTPLPHAKHNPRAREEATIRVRNALALLQQPRSSSITSAGRLSL